MSNFFNEYTKIKTNVHRINYEFNKALSSSDMNVMQTNIVESISKFLFKTITDPSESIFKIDTYGFTVDNATDVLNIYGLKYFILDNDLRYNINEIDPITLKINLNTHNSNYNTKIYAHFRTTVFTEDNALIYHFGLRNNSYNTFNIESTESAFRDTGVSKIVDPNLEEQITSRLVIELTFYANPTPRTLVGWSNAIEIGSITSQSNTITLDNSSPLITNADLMNHFDSEIYSETGIHGIRFFQNKLQYYNGSTWIEIQTGGGGSLEIKEFDFNNEWVDKREGSGTASDPYLIYTPYDFNNIRNNLTAYYKLMNNLDFTDLMGIELNNIDENGNFTFNNLIGSFPLFNSGQGFVPIGKTGTGLAFTGSVDFNYKIIKGLIIITPINTLAETGIFGRIQQPATLKNLFLDNTNIIFTYYSGTHYIGALVGYAIGMNVTIENISVSAIVGHNSATGNENFCGGVIGYWSN
jgi:hypothetical protein